MCCEYPNFFQIHHTRPRTNVLNYRQTGQRFTPPMGSRYRITIPTVFQRLYTLFRTKPYTGFTVKALRESANSDFQPLEYTPPVTIGVSSACCSYEQPARHDIMCHRICIPHDRSLPNHHDPHIAHSTDTFRFRHTVTRLITFQFKPEFSCEHPAVLAARFSESFAYEPCRS